MSTYTARLQRLERRAPPPLVADPLITRDAAELARRVGVDPDPWQADLLRADESQMILLCSRQAGKSTVSSWLALHTALYTPRSLVLLLAPALRQAQELFRKMKDGYEALSRPVPTVEESALRIELANGSRIVCLPGKEATIRGFSGVTLLIEDEASRCPDDLYMAIRPMVAVSGGRILLLSTPAGRRGHFFHEWEEGGADWHRVMVTAEQTPRIPAEWLRAERARIGPFWYRQEYDCEFLEASDSLFSHDAIQAALQLGRGEEVFAERVF